MPNICIIYPSATYGKGEAHSKVDAMLWKIENGLEIDKVCVSRNFSSRARNSRYNPALSLLKDSKIPIEEMEWVPNSIEFVKYASWKKNQGKIYVAALWFQAPRVFLCFLLYGLIVRPMLSFPGLSFSYIFQILIEPIKLVLLPLGIGFVRFAEGARSIILKIINRFA